MQCNRDSGGPTALPCPSDRPRWTRRIVAQFGRPVGIGGRLAGWIMARRPSNRVRNLWSVDLLAIRPDDHVLEIGFGPGLAVQALAGRVRTGKVCGLDHSTLMVEQARRRNAVAVGEGRVELRLGSADDVAAFGGEFDKVLAVNVVQFWDDPVAVLRRVRRVMRPGATIALTFQPRWRGATDEDARRAGEAIVSALHVAGFSGARLEVKPMKPVAAVCALANQETVRPGGS